MIVLLTGSTGYIGHQLALALAQKHIKVHALVRDRNSLNIPLHKNIRLFQGDICDYQSVLKAIIGCSHVIHTAAYTNLKCKRIDHFYNINVRGTENVLQASLKYQIKKFIFTSTLSVYGPSYKAVPIVETQPRITSYSNDYELTKSMAEELVKKYRKKGLSSIILNVSKVYGPGLSTFSNGVNRLVSMICKKDLLIVPNKLKIVSNYVFIKDVVNAHLLALESNSKNANYIIGGENVSYMTLFKTIKQLTNSKVRFLKVNYSILRNAFFIINSIRYLIGLSPIITPSVLDALFVNRPSLSDKAIAELNYRPTSLGLGLMKTTKHLNKLS
ncbi:NAD-dependent epimerase/dehydratase family protein [Aestuariivivens sediminis]|uniref:NAD-dependent epimerase/dehydratase family protein n=1 Tax=Aestuariivivens sediminis TaxID=2913557 RepID=UPI001F567398|nr:NAD-dependent epimerase/dehydratase family protein [Aestuariivivens sediminis]